MIKDGGLSFYHQITVVKNAWKNICTIFRSTFTKVPPNVVKYRSYKNLDENKFYHDLDHILIKGDINKAKDPYNKLAVLLKWWARSNEK